MGVLLRRLRGQLRLVHLGTASQQYPPLLSQRSHHVLLLKEQEETLSPSYKLGDLRKVVLLTRR